MHPVAGGVHPLVGELVGDEPVAELGIVVVLLRHFVEEEVSYLSALQSEPVSHVLADP
jgi:hypothetical protein